MPSVKEITPKQLMRLIGTPSAPEIVDVCIDDDFNEDPRLIPTSFRTPHTELSALVTRLKGKPTVVACQKGKKLSQGVAAFLRSEGVAAEYLQGGIYGWRDAGMPLIPAGTLPALTDGATLWVTKQRPKIDRVACPWLIRRFIDPKARFLFVAPGEVTNVAEKFNAIPFDVDGVVYSHRGDNCTFDTLISEFKLHTDALKRLATVVRAADTNKPELSEYAAGLLAISIGLSKQYKDDLNQIEAGFTIYDALYRWARDGVNETHDCTSHKGDAT